VLVGGGWSDGGGGCLHGESAPCKPVISRRQSLLIRDRYESSAEMLVALKKSERHNQPSIH
jgi:hypothetical protein